LNSFGGGPAAAEADKLFPEEAAPEDTSEDLVAVA
jgi:hypothetical protein